MGLRLFGAVVVISAVGYLSASQADNVKMPSWNAPRSTTSPTCVTIELDNRTDAHILDHAWDAIVGGAPVRLHIHRSGAAHNRELSLRGVPLWSTLSNVQKRKIDRPHWRLAHDRDEYPPAMSQEGGSGADIRYVESKENRDAGREMGLQLRGYPDGTCFQYESRPK